MPGLGKDERKRDFHTNQQKLYIKFISTSVSYDKTNNYDY